jgi:hypothetical protein
MKKLCDFRPHKTKKALTCSLRLDRSYILPSVSSVIHCTGGTRQASFVRNLQQTVTVVHQPINDQNTERENKPTNQ